MGCVATANRHEKNTLLGNILFSYVCGLFPNMLTALTGKRYINVPGYSTSLTRCAKAVVMAALQALPFGA